MDLIASARPRTVLYAEVEQFDSPAIERAVVAAAARGVTVDLVMPSDTAIASVVSALRTGGVVVRLYAPAERPYIHAKAISVNNETVYVGSVNFTTEMTNSDRNMGIITTDPVVVDGVTTTMEHDFAAAPPP